MASVEEMQPILAQEQKEGDIEIPPGITLIPLGSAEEIAAQKAVENEHTPEMGNNGVPRNVSPTSAQIMKSVFFKEMVVKTKVGEETSSIEGSEDESGDESQCSCANAEDSDADESRKCVKECIHFSPKEDGEDQKAENKEDVLDGIVKKLFEEMEGPDDEETKSVSSKDLGNEVAGGDSQDSIETVAKIAHNDYLASQEKAAQMSSDDEQEDAAQASTDDEQEEADPQTQAATNQLVHLLNKEQDKENGVPTPVDPLEIPGPAGVQGEEEAPNQADARPLTMEEKQLYILKKFTPGLEPVLRDDRWLTNNPEGYSLREALAKVGFCATEIILQALQVNPKLYHLKKEEDWFGRNMLWRRGVNAVLARIGVVEGHSIFYWSAFSHIQRFSGTYIFVRHAVDHGQFPERLIRLTEKAIALRGNNPHFNNPERSRTPRCTPQVQEPQIVFEYVHPALEQLAEAMPNAVVGRPNPLSPRVLNINIQQENPKKRSLLFKENQEQESPTKRQRTADTNDPRNKMQYFIFPRFGWY